MTDKVKAGEYVRNRFGDIYKIDSLEDYHFMVMMKMEMIEMIKAL